MTEEELKGRVAIVTGASRGRGIGVAIARALAGRGADIFFSYWRAYDQSMPWEAEEGYPEELSRELQATGVRALGLELDLSRPGAPSQLLDTVSASLGIPQILVNNATHSVATSYQTLDTATLDIHYAVNIRAPVLLSTEFARIYSGGPGGRIINLTSGQSRGPMPGELAYATTKGAIEAFTATLAADVADKGITVNAVNPGPTDTGWMTEEIKARLLPRFPMGRIGLPEDVARLIAFLASDDAAWITGQVIHSEGGFIR